MTKITPTEVDHLLAEKIMGWEAENLRDVILYKKDGKHVPYSAIRNFGISTKLWHPTVDKNQIWQCLEAWQTEVIDTSTQGSRYHIISPDGVTLMQGFIGLHIHVTNPNLNHAIATALLEAVTGERYEIKEQS